VRYDYAGLVYLATRDTRTGQDILYDMPACLRRPRRIHAEDYSTLKAMDTPNEEGFVLFFSTSGLRVKIKFTEYVRLHRLLTGLSEKNVWEMLRTGADLGAVLEGVPDEWFAWFDATRKTLLAAFEGMWVEVRTDWQALQEEWQANDYTKETHRKAMALEILRKSHPHILFAMLDGKPVDQHIWKLFKPTGARTFHEDIDHA
jgi:RNA ligase